MILFNLNEKNFLKGNLIYGKDNKFKLNLKGFVSLNKIEQIYVMKIIKKNQTKNNGLW